MPNVHNPLIVQSDRTLLLDIHAPRSDECRNALIPFAELERSPEHLHTYRITPLSLWNAASAGFTAVDAINVLNGFSRYDIPQSVVFWIEETSQKFGKLRLVPNPANPETLFLETDHVLIYKEILANKTLAKLFVSFGAEQGEETPAYRFCVPLTNRGTVKQQLLIAGFPVKDEVPLQKGEPLDFALRETCLSGKKLVIREYQKKAGDSLLGNGGAGTGFGTIVLPCGAGKTVVGMYAASLLKTNTLIVTTNISAVHQWINELLDKTTLTRDQIAEYTGESKDIKPVTVATYQILTRSIQPKNQTDEQGLVQNEQKEYPHFKLFKERAWGFIIYDEVHLLPAPVFRIAAEVQAIRRVGLTATLVREDGCEGHVFSLVGPKRYDVPWKELEASGWIATAECVEIRIDLDEKKQIEYAVSQLRQKHRIAAENQAKLPVIKQLIESYPEAKILVIGQYLEQLEQIAQLINAPIITGKTPNSERDILYERFRKEELQVLVVSKVANFAIDLPDASMAIQVSGTFGSRQEEAQRLGRILRPKEQISRFFTLITRNTVEEDFGTNRQKFLAEQGYAYRILRYTDQKNLALDLE